MINRCVGCFFAARWQRLLADADARKQRLLRLQDQYRQVEDLYLTFAKKASAFNSWFENAEEDLTDPVRCNSVEEILVSTLGEGEDLTDPVRCNSVEEILVSPSPPSPPPPAALTRKCILSQVFYVQSCTCIDSNIFRHFADV